MKYITGTKSPQERILRAATDLFAEVGYSGASTRDIARAAAVNDATVYRHFSSKKELFAAVLEAELMKLSVRTDPATLVASKLVASKTDVRSTLCVIFESLTKALLGEPRLLRLLQFSVLEFGFAMQPLYHRYLAALLDEATTYLESWQAGDELQCNDPRGLVVAFAVTVVALQTLYPLFEGEVISLRPRQENAAKCVDLWLALLVERRQTERTAGNQDQAN
jgi:AcrR family transcriptional regulator